MMIQKILKNNQISKKSTEQAQVEKSLIKNHYQN